MAFRHGVPSGLSHLKGTAMKKLIFLVFLISTISVSFAEEKRFNVPIGDSPVYGPENAPVTIIEFLDYQ